MNLGDARRLLTLREAGRLIEDVGTWVQHRKDADIDVSGYRGRYDTQLGAISAEVTGAAGRIRSTVANDTAGPRTEGEVCRDYNLHDQRLIWIRYAWSYFRDKLDQRDDEALKPVLEAADEVSWASYSAFFHATNIHPVPAAPIPYIEYDYVPSALRTGQSHVLNRKPGADAGPLETYFATLPVPLLRLPPSVVSAPWSLALICHEVGHLLQQYVAPGFAFFTEFADAVSAAVADAGGTEDERTRWSAWSQEIFADLSLACAAGPWAAWTLAPWVLTGERAMREPLEKYPPPLVRLILIDAFAQAADLPASTEVFARLAISPEGPPATDIAQQFDVARATAQARDVASIARRTFTINRKTNTLPEFLSANRKAFLGNGRVREWSAALLAPGDPIPKNDQTAARDAAAAAQAAYFVALANSGDLDALRSRSISLMRESYLAGVRAGTAAVAPRRSLSDALFELSDDEVLATR